MTDKDPLIELPLSLVKTLMLACALNEGLEVPNRNYESVINDLSQIEKRLKAAGHGTVYDWVGLSKAARS